MQTDEGRGYKRDEMGMMKMKNVEEDTLEEETTGDNSILRML